MGREDDVITVGGYRIGPTEIEDCLLKHPAVAMAAVIGVPDPMRTEVVKAFVVLRPGSPRTRPWRSEIQDLRPHAPRRARIPARDRVRRRTAADRHRQDHPPRAARARGQAKPFSRQITGGGFQNSIVPVSAITATKAQTMPP